MKNIILIYLFILMHLFAGEIQLKEVDGKYYYKNELYTGEKFEKRENRETIYETTSIYNKGELVEEKENIYNKEYIGDTSERVKGILISTRNKNYKTEIIDTVNYRFDGSLDSKGSYDFKFRELGIWIYYILGDQVGKIVDYDQGRKNNKGKDFLEKHDDSHIKELDYPEKMIMKDSNGNIIDKDKEINFNNFSGSMEVWTKDKITFKLIYNKGMAVESYYYFFNGQVSYETKLEAQKTFFGTKWVGVEREYYFNGNVKIERGVSQKWKNRSSFDLLKDSLDFNPSKMTTMSSGKYISYSYNYPFKQYYDNGQLMVEGDNYSKNEIEDLKVYDRKGNLIDFQSSDK